MQAVNFHNRLGGILLILLLFSISFKVQAQEISVLKAEAKISPFMMSFNILPTLLGEYGGNAIYSINERSQIVLGFNRINSEQESVLIASPFINERTEILAVSNHGFSISPEYRYIIKRSKRKNWSNSFFIGAYFKYQEFLETNESEFHGLTGLGLPTSEYVMNHIVEYVGRDVGLTVGVNLYHKNNLFLSLWLGGGTKVGESFGNIFNSSPFSNPSISSGRIASFRSGLSIGIYL